MSCAFYQSIPTKISSFNSNAKRTISTHINSLTPGPGSYQISQNHFVRQGANNRSFEEGGHEFDWLIKDDRDGFLRANITNTNVSPEAYLTNAIRRSPKYTWSKCPRF